MCKPKYWSYLVLVVLLLAAGCGEVPTAALPVKSPSLLPTPTAVAYPPPPTVPPPPTATPEPTLPPPPTAVPTATPIQPTPYAPAEALPEGFPTVIYAVQRLEQPGRSWLAHPAQLWTLRHERGMLREELLLDLSPSVLEDRIDPLHRYIGYNWVSDLSSSPGGRYVAITLRAWEGGGADTLVIQTDTGEIYRPVMPGKFGVGSLVWIPGSERFIVADPDRIMWGTMTLKGGDYMPFPIYDMLEAAVSPDGERVIFSAIPTVHARGIYLGAVDIYGSNLTPFAPPDPLPGFQVRVLALSPDGRTCALVWVLQGSIREAGQMWVMDADGSNQRPLTEPNDMYDFDFAWSPDGNSLAFIRWENFPTWTAGYYPTTWGAMVSSLWLIDLEGKERLLLSSEGRYAHWDPEWLPDGSGLVFVSNRGGENNLWFIRADGTGLQQLTRQGGLSPEIALLIR